MIIGVPTQFQVEFEIVKLAPVDREGNASAYRRNKQTVDLYANTNHPKDILEVLNRNVEHGEDEHIEILQIRARDWAGDWNKILR